MSRAIIHLDAHIHSDAQIGGRIFLLPVILLFASYATQMAFPHGRRVTDKLNFSCPQKSCTVPTYSTLIQGGHGSVGTAGRPFS